MPTTLAKIGEGLWLPEQASTYAAQHDALFFFILYVSIICFVIIGGAMVYFAIRYRQTDRNAKPHGAHHSNALEISWSIPPLIIVLLIFVWGFRGFLDMSTPKANSYEVAVQASQWNWAFEYPNGVVSQQLHVPADHPIRLVLQAPKVLHAFFVPEFRIKKDVVPGRYNKTWFESAWNEGQAKTIKDDKGREWRVNEYEVFCAEYCGTQHSKMQTKVYVHPPDRFKEWLAIAAQFVWDTPRHEAGEKFFQRRGCTSCHSVKGGTVIGPPLNDLFGRTEKITGMDPVDVDEDYLRESILVPSAKIVAGFRDEMSVPRLKDEEIDAIIWYLKSISKHYDGPRDLFEKPLERPDKDTQGEGTE